MLILRKITLHSRLQVYDSNVSNSSNNSEANLKKPFFYRLFSCCMHHPKPIQNNSDANETEFSSTNPTLQREPLTRKPAKMPDIYSTTQPKSKKCLVMSILNFPGFLGAGYIVQSAFDCFHSAISEVF